MKIRKYDLGSTLGKVSLGTTSSNNFMSSLGQSLAFLTYTPMVASTLLGVIPTPRRTLNSNNLMMADTRGAVSLALISSGNPYAMAAGAAVMAIDKTGGFLDGSKGLGKSTDTANIISSFALPGAGWFTSGVDTYEMSNDMKSMASGYGSSIANAQNAEANSGAKILFGRDKANKMIAKAKKEDLMISGIKKDATDDFTAAHSMAQYNGISNQFNLMGGYNQTLARAAKNGMQFSKFDLNKQRLLNVRETIARLDAIRRNKLNLSIIGAKGPSLSILDNKDMLDMGVISAKKNGGVIEEEIFCIEPIEYNFKSVEEIELFKEGGLMNVIPEGALHARKHNMEDSEDLTKKGIPVIDNDGNQQAEIEVNEIIFNKETSSKLEELWKQYKDSKSDELAIEAGKLIAKEVMENTDDRTGLINPKENEDS